MLSRALSAAHLARAASASAAAAQRPVDRVRRLLRVRHAVFGAPMWLAGGARMAAEVTRAGGVGCISTGYGDLKPWHKELDEWRAQNAIEQRKPGGAPLPMGIGLCEWSIAEHPHILDAALQLFDPKHTDAHGVRQFPVSALWIGFGDATQTVARIRARLGPHTPPLLCMAQTVEHALTAARWGADAIVAQGNESGGHGAAHNLSTLTLVPAIRTALNAFAAANGQPHDSIPVIAAGGLATGADAAAALALGAGGVAMGTRFCLTPESILPAAVKKRMRTAKGTDTVRSTVMDIIRFPWPAPFDARALVEPVITRWHGRESDLTGDALTAARADFDARGGRFVWCGSGVEKCNHQLMPAAKVVRSVVAECNAVTSAMAAAGAATDSL